MTDQRGNILGAARQAGNLEHHHPEPEEQVLAKLAVGDRGAQILMRRRNDANIDAAHLAAADADDRPILQHAEQLRSEEHTSELQSLMRISYAVFCLKKKKQKQQRKSTYDNQ